MTSFPTIKSLESKPPTCSLHMEILRFREVSLCSTHLLLAPPWTFGVSKSEWP